MGIATNCSFGTDTGIVACEAPPLEFSQQFQLDTKENEDLELVDTDFNLNDLNELSLKYKILPRNHQNH